jgi:hypothetical protein
MLFHQLYDHKELMSISIGVWAHSKFRARESLCQIHDCHYGNATFMVTEEPGVVTFFTL